MAAQGAHNARFGVLIASALGLVSASYFELEARGIVPNIFARRAPLLADVFSEQAQAHVNALAEPWGRALTFATALLVCLLVPLRDDRPSSWQRSAHTLAFFVMPLWTLTLTLVGQPLVQGDLCAPCLLESLFALAILEFRERPERADEARRAAARLDVRLGRAASPSMGMRRLGRDDAHR